MQTLIQNIQGNLPQIAGGVPAQEQKLLQGKQAQEPVLHTGQPVEEEQVVETTATAKPEKKTWGEMGLSLMEVSVPPALRHLLDDRERAVQIRKVEAGSLARQAGIRTGDFLTRLQEQEINTIHDIDVVLESIQGLDDLEIAVTHNDGLVDEYMLHLSRNDEK
jgi:S1-C subfamily serine protease